MIDVTDADISLGQLGGIAIGLSVCGAVFLNRAIVSLQPLLPDMSRVDIQRAVSGTSSSVFLSLPEETRKAALDVIVKSLTKV